VKGRQEGAPIFYASETVQKRTAALLRKQQASELSAEEAEELDQHEEIEATWVS